MPWWDTWDSDWADYPEILAMFTTTPEEIRQKELAQQALEKNLEISISLAEREKKGLHEIGLWAATGLGPQTLSRIVKEIERGNLEEARAILVTRCNSNFIEYSLINTWSPITAFRNRSQVFQDALFAHQSAKYILSIYALIPQIEGVISDWIAGLGNQNLETHFTKKLQQFHSLLRQIPNRGFQSDRTLESTFEFLKDGQPMQKFENWLDTTNLSFPGRHAIAHGKYTNNMFTEENSIKLFLMLDTICDFMMMYEVGVLDRNLYK